MVEQSQHVAISLVLAQTLMPWPIDGPVRRNRSPAVNKVAVLRPVCSRSQRSAEQDQGVGVAPGGGQVEHAGDLPELRRAGDAFAIESFLVVDSLGSLQLVVHDMQDLGLRQLGAAGLQSAVACHDVIELVLVQWRRVVLLLGGRAHSTTTIRWPIGRCRPPKRLQIGPECQRIGRQARLSQLAGRVKRRRCRCASSRDKTSPTERAGRPASSRWLCGTARSARRFRSGPSLIALG